MNTMWQMPAAILAFLAWLAAPPGDLADVAKREALRRGATPKATAMLSNYGNPIDVIPPSTVTVAAPAASPAPESGAKPAAAAQPAPPVEPPKDERWWRSKVADLRTALDRDTMAAEALQSRINALKSDSVNLDDPIKQAKARQDLGRALDELERTNKLVENGRKALADLQQDARRLNVPPGWIR